MRSDLVVALPRALLAAALTALIARTAWRAACAWVPAGGGRLAAGVTLSAGALTLGSQLLLSVGAFSFAGVTALCLGLGLAGRWLPAGAPIGAPPARLLALAPAAALLGWRWLRASVSPALAPDSMTYHLYRAARWVQLGHDAPEDWPDAAGYYEFFSAGAETLWALGLALTGDDLSVATVGLGLLLAAAASGYELARAFGASSTRAALAAGALCATPAAVSVALTGYADVWTLATLLLALAHVRRGADGEGGAHGGLAMLAAALHLLSKSSSALSAVPLGVLGGLWVWRDAALSPKAKALRVAVPALIALTPLLRAWGARGSPLYPLPLGPLHAGNPLLAATLAGVFSPGAPEPTLTEALRAFTLGLPGIDADPAGWGLAWIAAAPLAVASLARADRRTRLVGALALALALAGLASISSAAARELRTAFLPFSPRLYLALPGVLICLAARVGGPRWDALWILLAALSAAVAWPVALSPATSTACAQALPWLLAAAALLALARRLGHRAGRLGALVLALSLAFVGLRGARGGHREAILADMGGPPRRRAYEVNPVGGAMQVFWRAGDALSRDCARRVAAGFGWAPPGHRIFRYPLMGPRQEIQVVYVPVTHDGEVLDLADEAALAPRVDPARWYARLIALGVDHVVTSPPYPREMSWMLSRPSLFEPIAPEAQPLGVFRVRAVHRCPR